MRKETCGSRSTEAAGSSATRLPESFARSSSSPPTRPLVALSRGLGCTGSMSPPQPSTGLTNSDVLTLAPDSSTRSTPMRPVGLRNRSALIRHGGPPSSMMSAVERQTTLADSRAARGAPTCTPMQGCSVNRRLGAPLHAELGQQSRYVVLDGLLGEKQPFPNLAVGAAVGNEIENFPLPGGQALGDRVRFNRISQPVE